MTACKLFVGDCLEILRTFAEGSFDMVFADPPYNLSNGGFTCQSGAMVSVNKGSWDQSKGLNEDFRFQLHWMMECQRVLKEDGTIWVSGTYHNIYLCGYALLTLGFNILNDICWFKPNASPNLSCRYFTASHESLIWASKRKGVSHTFNYVEMKTSDYPEDKLKNPEKQMRTVWSIPVTPPSEKRLGRHPTQKPLALMDRVVRSSTRLGDRILDPFCGSGSTGVSALRNGRSFVGIDSNIEYVGLAKARIDEAMKAHLSTIESSQTR
jgi:site-specific DNA-methyltransferase (adenine-specific)